MSEFSEEQEREIGWSIVSAERARESLCPRCGSTAQSRIRDDGKVVCGRCYLVYEVKE